MKKRTFYRIVTLTLALFFLFPQNLVFAQESESVNLNLPCKSAVLIEPFTGQILYEQNPNERLPIASVTKVMTLLLTMEALEDGRIRLDENVPISENAASMGGSQVYLEPGEVISLDDVLKAVFVSSANDGAVALAELISGSTDAFVSAMNEKAAALGMHDSIFYNPTGLDDGETNLSSAHDVALMSAELLKYEKIYDYTGIWIDSIRNGAFGLSNTNKLIRFYPGATGLKTGSTAKAKYCVSASAKRDNLNLCAVILGGETSAERFQAAKTLLDYGFANWAFYEPESTSPASIKVQGGKEDAVCGTAKAEGFLIPKGMAKGITTELALPDSLKAPVEKGQEIGKLYCKKDGVVLKEFSVVAEKNVPALTLSDLFRRLLSCSLTGKP